MAAVNWIRGRAECPRCTKLTDLRCQTHLASSYEGDQGGRFSGNEYELDELMRWWPRSDPRWEEWKDEGVPVIEGGVEYIQEACSAVCRECESDLYAVVRFKDLRPMSILEVGLEENWPQDYPL